MIKYKDVFQLAESKGYNSFSKMTYTKGTNDIYIELCLIQKWLRDTHKTHLSIFFGLSNKYKYSIVKLTPESFNSNDELFNTYEECLLIGINEALKLIK